MTLFELWFRNLQSPELTRTRLSYSLSKQTLVSVRGKSASSFGPNTGTFQWTPAVAGLSILALYTAASHEDSNSISLMGEKGSLIASLDFAIGKPPTWLQEMIGVSKSQEPFAKRVFHRTNPEFKAGDQVFVGINTSLIPSHSISIYLDDEQITDREVLEKMAATIASSANRPTPIIPVPVNRSSSEATDSESIYTPNIIQSELKKWFVDEALLVLRHTSIFTQQQHASAMHRMIDDSIFASLAGKGISLLKDLKTSEASEKRLGLLVSYPQLEKELLNGPPLTVALPMGFAGCAAILYHLRDVKKYNISIQPTYRYAIEIMNRIVTGQFSELPDLCVIGSAPAATLLNHSRRVGYYPLLLAPGMSHRVVGTKNNNVNNLVKGEFLFLTDEPSTSGFYFDALCKNQLISKSNVQTAHAEPDEIFAALHQQNPDARGLLFFPYYQINMRFNDAKLLDLPQSTEHIKDSIIFYNESLLSRPKQLEAFELAFRDAWLDLRYGGEQLIRAVDLIISDPLYWKALERFSGLYSIL